ncbi:MAG: response regulator [bacterium]|nr:response regulator [bacterium]
MTIFNQNHEKLIVLVVDDDDNFRLLARTALEKAGFKIVEAENGAKMLEQFDAHSPGVILLDVNMPVMDGFEACRALREKPDGKMVPVIMLTGLDDIDSIKQSYEAGATDFISKPTNWLVLSHRILFVMRMSDQIHQAIQNELNNLAQLYNLPELALADLEEETDHDTLEFIKSLYTLQNIVGDEIFTRYVREFISESNATLNGLLYALETDELVQLHDQITQLKIKFSSFNAIKMKNACTEMLELITAQKIEPLRELIMQSQKEFKKLRRVLEKQFILY